MPVFKDFSENGELLQTRDEPLNADNFQRYIKLEGMKKALGYIDGLKYISEQIEDCFQSTLYNSAISNNSYRTGKKALSLYKIHFQFLEEVKAILAKPQSHHDTEKKILIRNSEQLFDFTDYVAKGSSERTMGFIDAVKDVTNEIGKHRYREIIDHSYSPPRYKNPSEIERNIPSNLGVETRKIYLDRITFLNFATNQINDFKMVLNEKNRVFYS